jgi:hypothetical protein
MEGDQKLWAGWKDESKEDEEELVVFWTDDLPDDGVRALSALGDTTEQRRFRHVG